MKILHNDLEVAIIESICFIRLHSLRAREIPFINIFVYTKD